MAQRFANGDGRRIGQLSGQVGALIAAADAMGITAHRHKALGLVDKIDNEPVGILGGGPLFHTLDNEVSFELDRERPLHRLGMETVKDFPVRDSDSQFQGTENTCP